MKAKNKYLFWGISVMILGIVFSFYSSQKFYSKLVREKVYVEYGTELRIEDILVTVPKEDFEFSRPLDEIKEVGTYAMSVLIGNHPIFFEVIVRDTTAPELEVQPLTLYVDENLPKAEDFVICCEDLNDCSLEEVFIKRKEGQQIIQIAAVDKYGNQTKKETTLTMVSYTGKPIFKGLTDISLEIGKTFDLKKGVEAYDKRFGSLPFTIDDTSVSYERPGTYEIFYTASNPLGTVVTKTRKITIKEKNITYLIQNFPTTSQYPKYPNGCETVALYNLLRYYQIAVSLEEMVEMLPKGESPNLENGILYGGDPEIEFVGDPRDLHGYGVFQKPILALANHYKKGMVDYTGHSLNEILSFVRQGIPVQVWVSIGLKNTDVCVTWIKRQTGRQIKWICNLHSVIVVGYDATSVYVSDSYTGKIENYQRSQFEKMYNFFGKRALYYAN